MTANEIEAVQATIKALWPRVRWEKAEWSVFAEGCTRIDIATEQADAALRHRKATVDKYPTVAGLLEVLRKLIPKRETTPDRREGRALSWPQTLRVQGLSGTDEQVVMEYHTRERDRSVNLYGIVTENVLRQAFDDFHRWVEGDPILVADAFVQVFGEAGGDYVAYRERIRPVAREANRRWRAGEGTVPQIAKKVPRPKRADRGQVACDIAGAWEEAA